jgi:hypothetical protein
MHLQVLNGNFLEDSRDVAIFNKDYVTSPLPSDTPAICFKNLHDLSTT